MTVSEAENAMAEIQKRINRDARIIWGANVDPEMGDRIRVLVLLTGVKSPYMISGSNEARNIRKLLGDISEDSGIDMV
jgi:cell division protein FtsZ